MHRNLATLLLLLGLLLTFAVGRGTASAGTLDEAIAKAKAYLASQQRSNDGHFQSAAGQDSRPEWHTAQALWALEKVLGSLDPGTVSQSTYNSVCEAVYKAKGYLERRWSQRGGQVGSTWDWEAIALAAAGSDLGGYLEELKASLATLDPSGVSTTDVARTLLVIAAAGGNAGDFKYGDGRTVVEVIYARQDADSGHFGNLKYSVEWGGTSFTVDESNYVNTHVWAVLALNAAGISVPHAAKARDWLIGAQNGDGSWGWARGETGDPDSTAAALRALAALGVGPDDQPVVKALDYLKSCQNEDGGIKGFEGASSSASDSEVLQAVVALGLNPLEDPWNRVLTNLLGLQVADASLGSDWVAVALSAAGEDITGGGWSRYGENHLDYLAERVAAWDLATTPTTTVERTLFAVAAAVYGRPDAAYNPRDFGARDLVALLLSRQDPSNGHIGNLQYQTEWGRVDEAPLVNSHVWGVLALAAAGESIPEREYACEWLLSAQNDDGGWGWSRDAGSDPDTTAMALRALRTLGFDGGHPSVQTALEYLKGFQTDEGGLAGLDWNTGRPAAQANVFTTAEAVYALADWGVDPAGSAWSRNGNNPVNFLLALQREDGSFAENYARLAAESSPLDATAKALWSLAAYVRAFPGADPGTWRPVTSEPGGGGQKPGSDIISVKVQVRGLDGAVMYPQQTVKLGPGEQNPLEALRKLVGRDKVQTAYGDAYVVAIGKLREKAYGPTSGWCYRVDGEIPQVPAKDYPLKDGAEVEWFYVRSVSEAGSGVGRVPEQEQEKIPAALKPSPEAQEVLEKLAQVLGLASDGVELGAVEGVGRAVAVVGTGKPLSFAERVVAKKELQANDVDLIQKVAADRETTLADAGAELALVIPAGALARDVEVRIREVGEPEKVPPLPPGFRLMSSPYDCGPEGTTFKLPATLSLRLVVPPVVKPENLVLARYDREGGTWSAVPAVVDLARGLVMARVRHFSILAVLAREARASFADVTGDSSWARDEVELLAGAGILKGVDENRFEPAREITRAEATAMLVRALGLASATTRPAFKDVRESDWYAGELAAAVSAGLIRGYEDGSFRPDRPITREELVTVLARALNLSSGEGANLPFADAGTVAAWARDGVAAAVSAGLVEGYPDGTFRPGNPITRAECAVVVYRALAE